ncbi:MAG: S8 family serine peptidase [Acidimicrobiales bacterium]
MAFLYASDSRARTRAAAAHGTQKGAQGMRHRHGRPVTGSLGLAACLSALVVGAALSPAAGAQVVAHAQYLNLQWGLGQIGAPTAWQYGTGGGVRIGIVDTGIDFSHEDLQGKVVASADFVTKPGSGCSAGTSAQDDNGHGTHVAGIAAASGSYGVSGVAPAAQLVVAKVMDCSGGGNYQDIVNGINWVVSQGARVVNLSIGDAGTGLVDQSQVSGYPLTQALTDAWNHGAIGVVAAGNNADGLLGLGETNFGNIPAIVVAATGPSGQLASYSNTIDSAQWGVAAPGGDDPNGPTTPTCGTNDSTEILSTYWTAQNPSSCYASDEGTSMGAPFVTGTLALLLGRGLTPSQAVSTLLGTANRSVSCGSDCSGLINASAAMAATVNHSSPTVAGVPNGGATAASGGAHGSSSPARTAAPGTTAGAPPAPSTTATTGAPASIAPRTAGGAAHALSPLSHAASGTAWWLVLPIVLGLGAAAAVTVVSRRALRLRRAVVQEPVEWANRGDTGSDLYQR